jgi:hypothetical protein
VFVTKFVRNYIVVFLRLKIEATQELFGGDPLIGTARAIVVNLVEPLRRQ